MLRKRLNKHNLCYKLEKVLPLVKKSIPELSGLPLSSIIVATAFASSKTLASAFHTPGCPFYSRQLPITELMSDATLQDKICVSCLKKEVHFLSSEAFCDDMEMRCIAESSEVDQVPRQLLSKIVNDYGSFSSFVEDLVFFSCNQASPGRTWGVFDGKKISIMSLPLNVVPLIYGLWPLALINMSERYLCDEILALSTQAELTAHTTLQSTQKPFWSRAARNPFSIISAPQHYLSPLSAVSIEDGDERLHKIRKQVAKKSVNFMRWSFVNNQLIEATNYFSSPERRTAHSEYRAREEREASLLALRNYKEHTDNIHDLSDTAGPVHSISLNASKRTDISHDMSSHNEGLGHNSRSAEVEGYYRSYCSSEVNQKATNESSNLSEEKKETNNQGQELSFTSSEYSDANATTKIDLPDPNVLQHADGSWEYQYRNGDQTFVLTDGTKVFKTEGVTTTVRTDGSTLFEYPNGSVILDRSDGIRITTYPDGTSKEEDINS
ncbi:unnamed protein product [Phytomonas sp. Hart1]|nr:unnamed protein product [Phytomonas sp. Hart1]|eukprot:CCW67579.1 unnamed protein product [Phytomonas sp. isolate Hart1]